MAQKQSSWLDKYSDGGEIIDDPKYTYDPKSNAKLKGDSREIIEKRLANAVKSKTQRAIEVNTALLKNMDTFEESKGKYIQAQQQYVKDYTTREEGYKKQLLNVKDKYGFDVENEAYENSSPQSKIGKRAVAVAKASMASGKGIPLSQDPNNSLTCINGVCTAASEAGVDYSGLKGLAGVVKNGKGKDIPQYNVSWTEKDNFKKAGYRRLGKDEKPQEGDFAQYGFEDDKNPNTVDHMEMVTEASDTGVTTFNNYDQTKLKTPNAGVEHRKYKKDSTQLEDIADTGYFRLDDATAKSIVDKDPQYKDSADKYKKFKESEDYTKYKTEQEFLNTNKAKYEESNKYLSDNIPKARNGACIDCNKDKVIKDDRGQWEHPGEITEIGSNIITMKGVPYPVLGISDTGDRKLMQPGEEYKFNGKKVTEFPLAQNGKKLDSPREWTEDYIQSPKYKQRLKQSGYKDVDNEVSERLSNVKDITIHQKRPGFLDALKEFRGVPEAGSHFIDGKVNMDYETDVPKMTKHYGEEFATPSKKSVEVHEIAHGEVYVPGEQADVSRLNDYDLRNLKGRSGNNPQVSDHDRNPRENKADLNSYRYLLKKQGIYDAGKEDFNAEHLKKSKKTFSKDRLMKNYSDKNLIWLMNHVANTGEDGKLPDKSDVGIARNGKKLINFDNKSATWLDKY
jgi:hypothetical protein